MMLLLQHQHADDYDNDTNKKTKKHWMVEDEDDWDISLLQRAVYHVVRRYSRLSRRWIYRAMATVRGFSYGQWIIVLGLGTVGSCAAALMLYNSYYLDNNKATTTTINHQSSLTAENTISSTETNADIIRNSRSRGKFHPNWKRKKTAFC
jgi:hypothetical protein